MIVSPNHSSRGGAAVRLVVIHTAEGALTAQSLGNFFAQTSSEVSSHVGIDDNTVIQYVDYSQAAWTMLSANPISDQAELCGFVAWSRTTWLQHIGMLNQAASWIRARCLARGIPIVKLSPGQVAAGQAGVCGHWDWTLGTGEGTHTDPGANFPWDYVMNRAANPPQPVSPNKEENMAFIFQAAAVANVNNGAALFPHGLYHDGAGNYVGLSSEAALNNLLGAGVPSAWVEQAEPAELLRLSRIGKDTPEPTHNS
jgi:hypothetical protein